MGIAMGPMPVVGKTPDSAAPETFQLLFQDPKWDYHTMDFDKDVARADQLGNNVMNAVDPKKLAQDFAHGGKIVLYHGWNDPASASTDRPQSVARRTPISLQKSVAGSQLPDHRRRSKPGSRSSLLGTVATR